MPKPLVSIMIPYFNSSRTLPTAIASVAAQTYTNWECILVDDGSRDSIESLDVLSADKRFRSIRLERNMGRGVARQAALEEANGDYLSMLDADDWLYPNKLEIQVDVMQHEADLVLVSTGMAIMDGENQISGVRSRGRSCLGKVIKRRFTRLSAPPVAFPPSLIRMEAAKKANFDPALRRSEDSDFLLKVLMGEHYAVLSHVAYAYNESTSFIISDLVQALSFRRDIFRRYSSRYPIASRYQRIQNKVKELVYRSAFATGFGASLIRRRSSLPSAQDIECFENALNVVLAKQNKLFY